jgi:NADPH-dependent 2,4-dienoyl-CoA reductase/sulfur reductase-like enzyme
MSEGIVIIGCGAAGATAAMQARKFNRDIKITLFNAEPYSQYSRCGLPYTISKKVKEFDDLVLMPPENWATIKVDAKLATTITKIDHESRKVFFKSHEGEGVISYASLIFATGSSNANPPI